MINFILFFLSYFSKTNSTDCTFIGIYSTRRNCIFCKIISIIETTVCQEKLQHLQKLKLFRSTDLKIACVFWLSERIENYRQVINHSIFTDFEFKFYFCTSS